MATRMALGASRGRLLRQLLIESLMLAVPSGLAGFGFAALTLHVAENIRIPGLDQMSLYFRLDPTVFSFALCAGVAAAIIAGLWPARAASKPDLVPALKGAGGAVGKRKFGLRGALVAGQLALSVVGITVAAMLTKGVWDLSTSDSGVNPHQVLAATMSPRMSGYSEPRAAEFQRQLTASLVPQPGVQAVTFATFAPGSGQGRQEEVLNPGSALLPKQETVRVYSNSVGPGFFRAFGIQLLRGREYRDADMAERPLCVVNAAMARRFWPDQPPLGQMVRVGGVKGVDHEVIGIARDTAYEKIGNEYAPFLYLPLQKAEFFTVLLRTDREAEKFAEMVRRAVASLDPDMPLFSIGSLAERLTGGGNGLELRLRASVFGTLGGIAVVLSSIGLYGVVAYVVSRRTREIGIRMALGAGRTAVLASVLKDGAKVVAAGVGTGVALSMMVCPLLTNRLFGVTPNDPVVILGTCAFLAAVAAAAMCVPARRACRVEAVTALRYE
jgi:predicted permease